MKSMARVFKNITLVTQFSFSLVMPVLLCLGVCWIIQRKTGTGVWIYIIGFILGLGGSFMVAYKLFISITEKDKKKRKQKASFNNHV